MMKQFISLENNQNHEDQHHGNFGPLWVETYQSSLDASKSIHEGLQVSLVSKKIDDFNGAWSKKVLEHIKSTLKMARDIVRQMLF